MCNTAITMPQTANKETTGFDEWFITAINSGALMLMVSIGHRAGLFDAVHDQVDPLAVLRGIYQTLKSGGIYLMQDIHSTGHVHKNMDHPLGPLLYTISCMHCMSVCHWRRAGTVWVPCGAAKKHRSCSARRVLKKWKFTASSTTCKTIITC